MAAPERDDDFRSSCFASLDVLQAKVRLLDAAHIIGDAEAGGEPLISNGPSLCSIHHRSFAAYLVGVSADYKVHVSQRLLEEDDGPTLELLKGFGFEGQRIEIPRRKAWRPDPERLAVRFERFQASAS